MIAPANTYGAQREWAQSYRPSSFCGMGHAGMLEAYLEELRRQLAKSCSESVDNLKKAGGDVKLTKEQKQELKDRYDPKNMTHEEYQSLIDKLCEFGVLDEDDKNHVSYGNMTPVESLEVKAAISPARENPMRYTDYFSSSNGNVLDWVKYLAGNTVWDEGTHSWQKTPESILFGKIQDVLESISG